MMGRTLWNEEVKKSGKVGRLKWPPTPYWFKLVQPDKKVGNNVWYVVFEFNYDENLTRASRSNTGTSARRPRRNYISGFEFYNVRSTNVLRCAIS